MTDHASALSLKRRPFLLADIRGFASDGWIAGKPFATQLLNAYTLLVPGGEHFVIRSCRLFMGAATTDLSAELSALFFSGRQPCA
jgi:predicted metal-dependent hydrolase